MRRFIMPVKKTLSDGLEKTAGLPLTAAKYTGTVAGEFVRGFAGRVFGPSARAIGGTITAGSAIVVWSVFATAAVLFADIGYSKYQQRAKKKPGQESIADAESNK